MDRLRAPSDHGRVKVEPAIRASDQFLELLRVFRREDGTAWTMATLAAKAGIDPSTLSKLKSGCNPNPTWDVMWKIAKAMKFRPSLWLEAPDQWPQEVQERRFPRPSSATRNTHTELAAHHLGLATGEPNHAREIVVNVVLISS